jgi:hypothetical protein
MLYRRRSSIIWGIDRLCERARELGIPADRQRVTKSSREQVARELHKPARDRFARNQTLVTRIDEEWEDDLADMSSISKEDDGYTFLLTCV